MGITQQRDQELGVMMLQKMPEPEPSFATLPVTDPKFAHHGPMQPPDGKAQMLQACVNSLISKTCSPRLAFAGSGTRSTNTPLRNEKEGVQKSYTAVLGFGLACNLQGPVAMTL